MRRLRAGHDHYRITTPFSIIHFAIIVGTILAIVTVAGVADATFGLGNLVIIGLLVPVAVRTYMAKRTALMVAPSGVTIEGRETPWREVGELVIIGPKGPDVIEVRVRRQTAGSEGVQRPAPEQGSPHLIARGVIQRSKYDPAELQAAFARIAPRTAALSGWGFDGISGPGEEVSDSPVSVGATAPPPSLRRTWWDMEEVRYAWDNTRGTLRGMAINLALAVGLIMAIVVVAVVVRSLVREDAVDPEFVGVYPRLSFQATDDSVDVPEDAGWLIGPHFGFAVNRVEVAGSLEALPSASERLESEGLPTHFRAPDGHELVVAYLSMDNLGYVARGTGIHSPRHESELSAAIVVDGGGRRSLDEWPETGEILVLSVPEESDPLLEVTDTGGTQSINLRTGERQQEIEGFYTEAAQELDYEYQWAGTMIQQFGVITDARDEAVKLSVESASREPWDSKHGYAAEGRAWLRVESPLMSISSMPVLDFLLDASATFVLVDEGGNEIPAMPGHHSFGAQGWRVAFDVPDTFMSGTLHIRPGSGSRWDCRCAWERPPPDDSITIELTERPFYR